MIALGPDAQSKLVRGNIRARHTDETRHMGVGGSLMVSARILRALVESQTMDMEADGEVAEEMETCGGAAASSPACAECGMSCPEGQCRYS